MPAIFIWKTTTPFSPTVKTIPYYAGSNWFLEDYGSHSKSAMYMDQQSLSDDGILFDIQWMPTNWVGPYVLEKGCVPYSLIREVEWGVLERLGNWMRFTTKEDIPVEHRENVWKQIRALEEEPCLINISMGLSSPTYIKQTSPKRFHQKRANHFTDVQTHV